MPGEEAEKCGELLTFDPYTAGGMMNTEFVFVGEDAHARRGARLDPQQRIESRTARHHRPARIARRNIPARFRWRDCCWRRRAVDEGTASGAAEFRWRPDADDKEVFELFDKYNLRSLAVVDDEGRPIGAIAVDDVVTRLRA